MTEKLLPCPFCGGEAKLVIAIGQPKSSFVDCQSCEISTNNHRAESESIAAWNRRAAQPAASAEPVRDALKGMQRFFGKWPEFVVATEYIGAASEAVRRMNDALAAPTTPADAQAQQDADKVDAQPATDTPLVDALTERWDDDGATRGVAYIELRDLARDLERIASETTAQRSPAMAGDRWLAIMEARIGELVHVHSERRNYSNEDRVHFIGEALAHARKRVQPASGEDTKLLDWLEEQLIDTIYLDDGRIVDVGGSKQPHDVRAAITKAMQQVTP